jgi:pyruvate,orthophosphate dikinase
MRIEANAETPKDAQQARDFGAEGIGLVRTEHMFFDPKRIVSMRKMILADTEEEKKKALDELLPYQTSDFEELFRIMDGYPVTIRLLDPPLHEFLPKTDKEIQELAKEIGVTEEAIKKRSVTLHELNPMLGHRGCRLCISRPEITQMQGKAIFTAAMNAAKKGVKVFPQIMIPLAVSKKEIQILKDILDKEKAALEKENNCEIPYVFGTMIELPRACLRSAELAEVAHFFSFGTNDLTQTTLGISRCGGAIYG